MELRIELPERVKTIITQLENSGEEGFAVGGCVRDSLLGKEPKDWDITTSATPERIKEIFHHTVDTGIAHGTVTVMLGQEGFEVTTYRIDGDYKDGRHPSSVTFTPNLKEDLRRRDFTINAMAYNDRTGIVDLFGGREDLDRHLIRCVGEARERFTEDALRIMRSVRFSAQLDFDIEEGTRKAARELAPALNRISAERVRDELVKLLISDHPERIRQMYEMGITAEVLPEFDAMMKQPQNGRNHEINVGEHTILALQNCRPDPILRLTMLLHDVGKPPIAELDEKGIWHFHKHAAESVQIAKKILRRLKCANDTICDTIQLIRYHSEYPELTEEGVRRSIRQTGEALYPKYLEVKYADVCAQKVGPNQTERFEKIRKIRELYEMIMDRGDCLSLKQLQISGSDLIRDGMQSGKQVGTVLEALLDDVLAEPQHNTIDYLLPKSRKLRSEYEIYSDTSKRNE